MESKMLTETFTYLQFTIKKIEWQGFTPVYEAWSGDICYTAHRNLAKLKKVLREAKCCRNTT